MRPSSHTPPSDHLHVNNAHSLRLILLADSRERCRDAYDILFAARAFRSEMIQGIPHTTRVLAGPAPSETTQWGLLVNLTLTSREGDDGWQRYARQTISHRDLSDAASLHGPLFGDVCDRLFLKDWASLSFMKSSSSRSCFCSCSSGSSSSTLLEVYMATATATCDRNHPISASSAGESCSRALFSNSRNSCAYCVHSALPQAGPNAFLILAS